ncbi:hypothetical protein KLP40_06995 [Hymenobacter sp. NST-14]|uniref:hypothetical protein n=1 Tax=Hymenobacter piscis TaxID=2839984 RepID=UPI001C0298AB|nr:hypothetical protein [Hymenobacter piscis]MBT9392903.1 hypothetical protein [Hymenobacter piscis]
MKSSNIKEKHFHKRINILKDLVDNLDFSIDVLAINKSYISSEGLKQKRTFYKYFQNLFVSKYNNRYNRYDIWADAVGTDFRNELSNYIQQNGLKWDLFYPERTFQLTDEKSGEKLVQLADFISGCIGKIFCTSHQHERARELYNIIHARTFVEYFPFDSSSVIYSLDPNETMDQEIRKINLQSIEKYIYNNDIKSSHEKSIILNYLRLQSEINPKRLVSTLELVLYLRRFFSQFTVEKLRILIRDLRFEGLFIISHSGKPGYKLATSYQDIYEHFNHFLKYVIPMLQKVQILNEALSSHSFNKINPIEKDGNMHKLKELLSGLN